MRVIAGSLGGRRLRAPAGTDVRPTSDRVREAVFSMLAGDVVGARVLDLFAGTGALGIEAISRGAAQATFVDSAPGSLKVLSENLRSLGVDAEVHRSDALAHLASARATGREYDLVFLDPPYRRATELAARLSPALGPVLAPQAVVVCETSKREPLELELELLKERRYGETLIRIHVNS